MGLLKLIWGGIVSLAQLFIWPVAKLSGMKSVRQVVRWSLHFLILGATLGLLWYINYAWELDKALRVPVATLRHAWLPLLFLLSYFTAWCTWWLWRLVMAEDRPSDFPDIDAAWHEAVAALEKANINLTQLPLFLVVGRPAETEAAFFSATQLPFTHPQIPRDPNAPLHVQVAAEGIFVTCPGASLLGAQTKLLAADRVWRREEPLVSKGRATACNANQQALDRADSSPIHVEETGEQDERSESLSAPSSSPASPDTSSASSATSTKLRTTKPARTPSIAATQLSQGLSLVEDSIALLAEEERAVPEFALDLALDEDYELAPSAEDFDVPLIKDLGEIQSIQARLEHLCRLIATSREPYCPLNGVAVLIPYGAAANDRLANQVAALGQRDLEIVQQTLRVRCPLVTIVCDLQEAPGCKEMLQLFPERQRHRRLGVRFPLMCNDPSADVPQTIDNGMRWICRDLLPPLVYRLMRGTTAHEQNTRNLSPTNVKLYRFLDDIRQREQRLSRIMRQIFTAGNEKHWLPAGCYLVANGADIAREQGFAAGVLPQLYQMQNLLAWTPAALVYDKTQCYKVWAGYTLLALGATLLGIALLRLF
jgi:hypothetical protein